MVGTMPDLIRNVARRLARVRPQSVFEGLSDPTRALLRLRDQPPDLLVADAQLAGMSGLELVAAYRATVPDLSAIIVAARPSPELRAAVEAAGNAELLAAPVSTDALLAAIDRADERRAAPKQGFSGRLRLPMLPDLIQTLAHSRASVALQVKKRGKPDEAETGWIWFLEGEVVHARRGALSGTAAFYDLLSLEAGSFASEPCLVPPERSISARWEELLMEGLRRIDEEGRGTAPDLAVPLAEFCCPPDEMRFLRQSIPPGDGNLVTVAFRPSSGRAAFVSGGRDEELEDWTTAVAAMTRSIERLSSEPAGLYEDIREDVALALSWSWPRDRAVLLCQAIESVYSVSRFRLRSAAFHRAVSLGDGGGGETGRVAAGEFS